MGPPSSPACRGGARARRAGPPSGAGTGPASVELGERLGSQRVEAPAAVGPHLDEAGLAEHAQVLGGSRLAQPGRGDELAHRAGPIADQVEDAAPIGLREDVECADRHSPNITRQSYDRQVMRCAPGEGCAGRGRGPTAADGAGPRGAATGTRRRRGRAAGAPTRRSGGTGRRRRGRRRPRSRPTARAALGEDDDAAGRPGGVEGGEAGDGIGIARVGEADRDVGRSAHANILDCDVPVTSGIRSVLRGRGPYLGPLAGKRLGRDGAARRRTTRRDVSERSGRQAGRRAGARVRPVGGSSCLESRVGHEVRRPCWTSHGSSAWGRR